MLPTSWPASVAAPAAGASARSAACLPGCQLNPCLQLPTSCNLVGYLLCSGGAACCGCCLLALCGFVLHPRRCEK